jgi:hypothetical protein
MMGWFGLPCSLDIYMRSQAAFCEGQIKAEERRKKANREAWLELHRRERLIAEGAE